MCVWVGRWVNVWVGGGGDWRLGLGTAVCLRWPGFEKMVDSPR